MMQGDAHFFEMGGSTTNWRNKYTGTAYTYIYTYTYDYHIHI